MVKIRGSYMRQHESEKRPGPLDEMKGRPHGPPSTAISEWKSYGPPNKDLKAHDQPNDYRADAALVARRADRLAELYRKSSSDYRLQIPGNIRDPVKLRKALQNDPLGTANKLEQSLGVDLSKAKTLPKDAQAKYVVSEASHYLDHKIADVIAKEKAKSPVGLQDGKMVDIRSGVSTAKYRHPHQGQGYTGHLQYKLAAAVIGITILLILGTSFFTGQITGASITALDSSPQFPYTLVALVIVAFLFTLLWQHAKEPDEVETEILKQPVTKRASSR